jgi:hypothetical protein
MLADFDHDDSILSGERMLFPARELQPYGEPVPLDQLSVGGIYFGVYFLDEECFVPVLEPRVFIGCDLEPADKDKFYFQDYASYRDGVRYDDASHEDDVVFQTDAEKRIFEYEKALEILLGCSLRRQAAGR